MKRFAWVVLSAFLLSHFASSPARAAQTAQASASRDCAMAMANAAGQYAKRRLVASTRCRLAKGADCGVEVLEKRLSSFEAKLAERVSIECAGGEVPALAPEGLCPDPTGRCAQPVSGPESAVACIACLAGQSADALDRILGPRPGRMGEFCGGCAGDICSFGAFCEKPDGACGDPFAPGVCVAWNPGLICTANFDPVCGCDDVTYSNDCERLGAGVTEKHEGECASLEVCGGILGQACGKGEVCETASGGCDIADAQGLCVPLPQACPELYMPVCGCDGVTYGNACERLAAGVGQDHDGPCKMDPPMH